MSETPAEYTRRILANLNGKDALAVQASTPGKIARAIRGLSRRKLMRRPASGKWSIGEILAHLAEAELAGGYRLRMILGSNGTAIHAFDQNVWARNADYARQDPQRSLEVFRTLREFNLALLRSIPARIWKHYGVHQERGKETVSRITEMFAGHDLNHLRQIENIAGRHRGRHES